MFRNIFCLPNMKLPKKRFYLLHNEIQSQTNCCFSMKNSHIIKQSKILSKLYGERISGTKRKCFPSHDTTTGIVKNPISFALTQKRKNGKNVTRRMQVLNKLFMEHITDLMATGEISTQLMGRGLQITRVKVSPDFCFISVFWLTTGNEEYDKSLDVELQHCSGILRHELSQLHLMGVVPRIKFVKDKLRDNVADVEQILKRITFSKDDIDEEQTLKADCATYDKQEHIKHEFYGIKIDSKPKADIIGNDKKTNGKSQDFAPNDVSAMLPMRHDVFGLDYKTITLKILTKMRKSAKAWEEYTCRKVGQN